MADDGGGARTATAPARRRTPRIRRLGAFVLYYKWHVFWGLFAATVLFGWVGFCAHGSTSERGLSVVDNLYRALQLFTLESGGADPPVGLALQAARLLAPVVAVWAAALAIARVFEDKVQLIALRFSARDHVVVCGLGEKGLRLARAFHDEGYLTVVIERDASSARIRACESAGIVALEGDATDKELLAKAMVHRARYLFLVCGDDSTNAAVCENARELAAAQGEERRRGRGLTCYVHIFDLQLCRLLRERELTSEPVPGFRVEICNVFEAGAWTLLHAHPPLREAGGDEAARSHVLVVGLGYIGESLASQAARLWRERRGSQAPPLHVIVVDRDARERVRSVLLQYPGLRDICEFEPHEIDVESADFREGEFLFDSWGELRPQIAYVCVGSDSPGLGAALALHQRTRDKAPDFPIVVLLSRRAGLDRVLPWRDLAGVEFGNIHTFGLLDEMCQVELAHRGLNEVLARAIHEKFLARHEAARAAERGRAKAPTTPPKRSLEPWERLAEHYRESNRAQADNMARILAQAGYRLTYLAGWDGEAGDAVTPSGVELMAKMEHERWCRARLDQGWEWGEPRDDARRKHPDLLPWNDPEDDGDQASEVAWALWRRVAELAGEHRTLAEVEKEKCRAIVRAWVAILAEKAEFQVERVQFAP